MTDFNDEDCESSQDEHNSQTEEDALDQMANLRNQKEILDE